MAQYKVYLSYSYIKKSNFNTHKKKKKKKEKEEEEGRREGVEYPI